MKCFCIWAITAVISFSAYSQSDFDRYSREQKNDFENYKKERQSDFLSYRKKRNAEFADYLAKRWEYFDVVAGRKKPLRPEPPAPIVKKVNEPTFPVRLPDVQIEEIPPVVQPKPVDYPVVLPLPGQPQVEVEFYGMRCTIPSVALQGFELLGLKEEQIARAWKRISSGECDALVSCCNRYGRQMNLCDWGYVELSGRMAKTCLSSGNEAVLLQTYLLTQLGYDARLLRRGNTLTMMIPCSGTLYGYASLNVAGRTYYVLDKTIAGGGKVETYRKNFSEADRVIDLSIRRELNLAERRYPKKGLFPNVIPTWKYVSRRTKTSLIFMPLIPIVKIEFTHKPLCRVRQKKQSNRFARNWQAKTRSKLPACCSILCRRRLSIKPMGNSSDMRNRSLWTNCFITRIATVKIVLYYMLVWCGNCLVWRSFYWTIPGI